VRRVRLLHLPELFCLQLVKQSPRFFEPSFGSLNHLFSLRLRLPRHSSIESETVKQRAPSMRYFRADDVSTGQKKSASATPAVIS